MAKKDALLRQAEMMFIELGNTAKEIAGLLSVRENTIGKWRKAGEWDKRRNELLASPHKIKELLLKEFQSVAQGNTPLLNADSLLKIARSIESVDTKINPRIVITIIKLLDDFTAEMRPDLAPLCLEIHKLFILHIIDLYG